MLWGHLKAEDFMNLLDGGELPARKQAHLQACPRCTEMLEAAREVQLCMKDIQAEPQGYVPEPDWNEFRLGVRNSLLSRSVKRAAQSRRWFGVDYPGWRPAALATGMAVMLIVAFLAGIQLYRTDSIEPPQMASIELPLADSAALKAADSLTRKDVFDELLQLNADETESLRQLLDQIHPGGAIPQ